jgi:prepilin signal peptidase PulO-like enzyme (type II secretory pathway)
VLAVGTLGLCCAGAAVSLSQHLPDGATHAVDGQPVWPGFISGGGTAMSPPLPVMIVFAAAIAASASRRWVGMLGAAVLAIGGAAFTIGIAIEPITPWVLTAHPDPLKTPLTILALIAAPATALAAGLHLRHRMKARTPEPAVLKADRA